MLSVPHLRDSCFSCVRQNFVEQFNCKNCDKVENFNKLKTISVKSLKYDDVSTFV